MQSELSAAASSQTKLDLDSHIQPCPETYELVAGEIGVKYKSMFDDLMQSLPPEKADRVRGFCGT